MEVDWRIELWVGVRVSQTGLDILWYVWLSNNRHKIVIVSATERKSMNVGWLLCSASA